MSSPNGMMKKTHKYRAAAPGAAAVSHSPVPSKCKGLRRTAEELDAKLPARIRVSSPNETSEVVHPEETKQEIDDHPYQILSPSTRGPDTSTILGRSASSGPMESSIFKTGLAVATEVGDESDADLMQAEEVDPAELERKRAATKNKNQTCILTGLFVMMVAVVAAVLAVAFGMSSKNTTPTPTRSPSLESSAALSSAPSGALAPLLQGLPDYTLESLKIYSTPQWNAREWLQDHPELPVMPEWRKKQLFALATFFYAMEGPNWPRLIRDDWMSYQKSECFWFSNEFGGFYEGSIGWTELSSLNITPCNDRGEFQYLALGQLDLAGYHPQIPPEISLLSSLFILALPVNGINSLLADFSPSQIYQMTSVKTLSLGSNVLSGGIPSQFGMMTSMVELALNDNAVIGPIPTELGLMTNTTLLDLDTNGLSGGVPSQFGLMTNMVTLVLYDNALSDPIPTELGSMTNMTVLYLDSNGLSGEIPSQLGLMTDMVYLGLSENALTGPIPTELGLMTSMTRLNLFTNGLSGGIPSQFGLLNNMVELWLANNQLMGIIPSEIAKLTNMEILEMKNNSLTGTIPTELGLLAVNGSLIAATFANNTLSGTVPAGLCSMGLWTVWSRGFEIGLSFDCGDRLCGCCWCPCPGSYTGVDCQTQPYLPSNGEIWPGGFPVPLNTTNVVIINLFSDDYPEEITLEWSMQEAPDVWEMSELQRVQESRSLHSYTMQVVSNATYRLQVLDSAGDGICCVYGFGWLTITNSTPSDDHANGTVLWEAHGDFESSLEVLLWIDPHGHAEYVEDVP